MTGARFAVGAALAALFCAGVVAAFGGSTGSAAEKIGTSTGSTVSTATTTEPTTEPQTTVQETTVQLTVTNTHTIRSGPSTVVTTASTDTSSGTGTWALVAIGIAIVVLVALIVWLVSRHKEMPAEQRRRVLAEAVAAWVAQGWAPVSQTDTTAVLRRGADHLVLAVDAHGNISSQAVDPTAP
jgi:hypothetical protein